MKYLTILVLLFSTFSIRADCSKKITEKKVNQVCIEITKNGKAVFKKWPADLIFNNCGKNYVWVQDTKPEINMIMHPIKQRLNNTPVGNQVDEKLFPLFIEFDKTAKKNLEGGWVEYVWPKSGEEKATPKISFVKLCKLPSGEAWVVGSGVWKADL